ncbi:hypothetical protein ACXZ1K_19395 [Pedobacter sp. PWIIR3]
MKLTLIIFTVLSFFSISTFGQSQKNVGLTRRQGQKVLDNTVGFGDFIFGSPPKLYKKFKAKPDLDHSKRRFSKVPIMHEGIKIDSIYLDFSSDKLSSITMYTNKSNMQKLKAYCVKNFGPVSHDYDPKASLWYGRKKRLSFYEIENSVIEILFSDISMISEDDLMDTTTSP